MTKQRDLWVDYVKLIACILVVLGHFFQSMVKAGIIQNGLLYEWFNTTIYYFHVPLFFICSGFLFQRYSSVRSLSEWKNNVIKKLVALGIPYIVFSTATWIMKKIFSSDVNDKVGGWFESIFFDPLPPYWYLYVLIFIFLLAFTVKKRIEIGLLFCVGFVLKILSLFSLYTGIYAINRIMEYYIWFLIGVSLPVGVISILDRKMGIIIGVLFLVASILPHFVHVEIPCFSFVLGMAACYSIISIVHKRKLSHREKNIIEWLAHYTMPVFLMHTMFAAPIRIVLIKLGIENVGLHFWVGLLGSFIGPIIAVQLLEKFRPMDFIIYPRKYM